MVEIMSVINEQTSAVYVATLTAEDGSNDATVLTELTLTLYDKTSGTIINGREEQDVLNKNGVTLYSEVAQRIPAIGSDPARSGNMVWLIERADNEFIGTGEQETHVALFKGTWGAGVTKGFMHKIEIPVDTMRVTT